MDAAVVDLSHVTESRGRDHVRTARARRIVLGPTARVPDTVRRRGLTVRSVGRRRSLRGASRRRRRNGVARVPNRASAGGTAAGRLPRHREPDVIRASHRDGIDATEAESRKVARRQRREIATRGNRDETIRRGVTAAAVRNGHRPLLNAAIPRVRHLWRKRTKVDIPNQVGIEEDLVETENMNRTAKGNRAAVDRIAIPTPEETAANTSRRLPSIDVTGSLIRTDTENRHGIVTKTKKSARTKEANRKIKALRMRMKRNSIRMKINRIEKNVLMLTYRGWTWTLTVMTDQCRMLTFFFYSILLLLSFVFRVTGSTIKMIKFLTIRTVVHCDGSVTEVLIVKFCGMVVACQKLFILIFFFI